MNFLKFFWLKMNKFAEITFKRQMQKIVTTAVLIILIAGAIFSCNKYKSPKGYTDPNLTNHYCNDPNGVNYNWGFPGIPDNTVCFYPTDVFAGKYLFKDSVYLQSGYLFIFADSIILTIKKLTDSQMCIYGMCPNGDSILMTATPLFTAYVDTVIGDSVTNWGQSYCGSADTIVGSISQNRIDSILTISFQVASDSGIITMHTGSAKLIK